MRSLRSKITLLSVLAVTVAITVATVIGVISIANFGHESSEESLRLLCEEGKNNLNDYFDSVEQSAGTVSDLISSDLKNRDVNDLTDHVALADSYFKNAINHTGGVATYYYRFNPDITEENGFWYVDEGQGLKPHAVTNLKDASEDECLWFYDTRDAGEAIWLLPYDTDSLDSFWVVSYNVPIYQEKEGQPKVFIGVVGIEIGYQTLGEQIKDIKALETGYAFIVENENGTIICHPKIDLLGLPEGQEKPQVPKAFVDGLKGPADKNGGRHIEYRYTDFNINKTVEKHCYVLPLTSEDMSVVVCVPLSEVNALWLSVVIQVVIAGIILIAISFVVAFFFSRRITKPLKELTVAAEAINNGNYDVKLDYKGNDEMAVLTTTVNRLIDNLGGYINDLNVLAYADALTNVRNRSAYEIAMREIQKRLDDKEEVEFAIALFDCDDLKLINDEHGHDKGNVYLRNSCHLICRIFQNSVVYRVGGDEFVAILQDGDYKKREELKKLFIKKSAEICAFAKEPWEQIRVSVGVAAYDPSVDTSVKDVAVHADHLMYENKRQRKKNRK